MQQETHHIIHDPEQVKRFAKEFIPELSHHAIVLQTFTRAKYCPELPKSEFIIDRTIVPGGSEPERFYQALRKVEVPIGTYLGPNNFVVPDGSTVTYCLIQPKDQVLAMNKALGTCVSALCNDPGATLYNPYGMYKKEISTTNAAGVEKYMQIDLDSKEPEILAETARVLQEANVKPIMSIETRGGIHIVYRKTKDINGKVLHDYKLRTVFEKVSRDGKPVKDYIFSITREPNVAVPGTMQGGFPVKICDDLFC